MTIGTGTFSLRDVVEEVFGVGFSGTKSLVDCFNNADPDVSAGALPVELRSFAGHTQDWGRVYSHETISLGGYLKRETQGDYHAFAGGETLEFTGDRNESVGVYKSGTGTPITAGDAVRLEIYYRTKQTSGSWTFSVGWNNYASATYGPHALTLTVNDYKFVLTTNI
jgi:hypothetical protein